MQCHSRLIAYNGIDDISQYFIVHSTTSSYLNFCLGKDTLMYNKVRKGALYLIEGNGFTEFRVTHTFDISFQIN